MSKFFLSEAMLSEAFWPRLEASSRVLPSVSLKADRILEASRVIHQRFPQETAGSISKSAIIKLYLLARYFRPRVVAEVGTFIGRSTLALGEGGGAGLSALHTCDFSFDAFGVPDGFIADFKSAEKIHYHAKTASTEMFRAMLNQHRGKVDCFFLDGRLSGEDIEYIKELRHAESVFIIDDFEGVEKGVSNALLLRQTFQDLVLIRPEVECDSHGGPKVTNTALMFGARLISLSRQQELPLDMC
jgi:hypothetical protein